MSLLDVPLAVSIPAWELEGVNVGSSVFGPEALYNAALSPRLSAALALIEQVRPPHAPLSFVARPEIFTDGATLAWLQTKLGAAADHLALSDGSTVRLLPSFRNHVFFYGLGWREDSEALTRLERRVPEIFEQLHSQINTALCFRNRDRAIAPPTVAIYAKEEAEAEACDLRRLFLNRNSVDDSVARMLASPLVEPESLGTLSELTYVRLTSRGLADPELTRRLANAIASRFVDLERATIFVLPQTRGRGPNLQPSLRAFAAGLLAGGCRIPLTPAPNLFIASGDLAADRLAAICGARRLVVDDGDDFWRSTAGFYRDFAGTTVFAQRKRHRQAALEPLWREAYGENLDIVWTSTHKFEPA